MKLKIALTLSLLASPVFAADSRKIDFTQVLRDHRGAEIVVPDSDQGKDTTKPFTLGAAVAQALLFPEPQRPGEMPNQSSYVEKARRAQLAIRLEKAPDAELTAEEISKIKTAVGLLYPPITVLRIVEAIDPASLK